MYRRLSANTAALMHTSPTPLPAVRRGGSIDRSSCEWRDAVGPGFATGVSESVVGMVAASTRHRYHCA